MPKLTRKIIDELKPDLSKERCLWDTEIKGFGIRIQKSDKKTFIYVYRNSSGKLRKFKLGNYGSLTVEQARERALKTSAKVILGEDPVKEKEEIVLARKNAVYTVSDLINDYMLNYAPANIKKITIGKWKSFIRLYILPEWGARPVNEIKKSDAEKLKASLKDKKTTANQVLCILSSMFNHAIEWGKITENPITKVKKYKEHKRLRWADGEEFERLWSTLQSYKGYAPADVLIFILLTGSRKSEVFKASWDQFDLEKGIWVKPHINTKQQRNEYIPLSHEAIEFLQELRGYSSDYYLFPGRVPGSHITDVKKFWAKVLKEANIDNLRIHDLRHTYASHLVSSGLSLSIVGRLLGHSNPNTTQRYAHLADQALRDATNLFAGKLKKITQKDSSSKEPSL
ncbi:MAG: tyrosine-type recombinase/integrase [Alphaproteobacteria bacterium]|nr:tyrosine-type recombinase/integrase [Alphaproteobacteria bacterium]OJV45452.1 MAG: hypothetical protein BGO28_04980 [Alphaproteobacteria bacterium 43-37]